MKPQSPIHRPLEGSDLVPAPPTRIARLVALDTRRLTGRRHSLGPGGASGAFTRAIEKALVEEMADQLRGKSVSDGPIGDWAADIIAAFCETEN